MYNNPLITIPRLQHSPNQAGYTHSHPHSTDRRTGAVGGSVQGGPTGDPRSGKPSFRSSVAPSASSYYNEEEEYLSGLGGYQKPTLQKGVSSKPSNVAPSASWQDVRAAKEASGYNPWESKYRSSGAVTGALGNNVGGSVQLDEAEDDGGIWGGIKGTLGDIGGSVKDFLSPDTSDGNVGMQGAFASNIAPPTDGDKATAAFTDSQWTPEQWWDAGYEQQPDGSWDIRQEPTAGQETEAGFLPLVGSAAGTDPLQQGFAEPKPEVEDVGEIPDYWKTGESFIARDKYGQIGGDAWNEENFAAAYTDLMENFWTKIERRGYSDKQGIGTSASNIFASAANRGGKYIGSESDQNDLAEAIKNFMGSHISGTFPDRGFTLEQKKEVLYHELKALAEAEGEYSDESYHTFVKQHLGITDANIESYGGTVERAEAMVEEDVTAEPSPIGTLPAETNEYINNVSNIMEQLSGRTVVSAGLYTHMMIDQINQPIQLPEGYEVERDLQGQPQIKYKGRIAGYMKDGTPRYKHTDKKGDPLQRPNEAQIQAINSALQAKEMGQKAMHEYMGKQLGLNIKRQEAGIVSSQFTKTLEHNASQLALERDKFESNEQLAQAETLGIFTAEDGTEQTTLSREELMARLTGKFGVTTTKSRLVDGEMQPYLHTKMEDTVEMQKLKADLTGRFKDAKGVMQDTITKQQFEAAVKGYLQDKSPTFAREQFEEQKSINRNNALLNAGFVMAQKFDVDAEGNITSTDIYADPETGQPTTVAEGGQRLKTMEARRLELDELIAEAKINQNQTVQMAVLDAEGKQVYETLEDGSEGEPMMDTVTVNYLDRLRMNLDQQRLDHMMAMEATAMIGKDEAGNLTMDAQRLAIEQTRADSEARRVEVQSEDIEARREVDLGRIGVEEQRAQAELQRAETSAQQEARALQLQEAQIGQIESEGLSAQRGGLGQFKGDTTAENMKAQRQQYMTNLNDGLSKATAQDFEALEAAISTAMPPVPAGMVWDGNSGTLVFRRG